MDVRGDWTALVEPHRGRNGHVDRPLLQKNTVATHVVGALDIDAPSACDFRKHDVPRLPFHGPINGVQQRVPRVTGVRHIVLRIDKHRHHLARQHVGTLRRRLIDGEVGEEDTRPVRIGGQRIVVARIGIRTAGNFTFVANAVAVGVHQRRLTIAKTLGKPLTTAFVNRTGPIANAAGVILPHAFVDIVANVVVIVVCRAGPLAHAHRVGTGAFAVADVVKPEEVDLDVEQHGVGIVPCVLDQDLPLALA